MSYNIGYKFYKEYFGHLKIKRETNVPVFDGKGTNKSLFDLGLKNELSAYADVANETFCLRTIYPGLLLGSGYMHEIGSKEKDDNGDYYVKNELKLGFFFDHTSGLPCIPGSSVKGVLRNACSIDKGKYIKWFVEQLASGKPESKLQSEFASVDTDVFLFKNNKESQFIKSVFEAPENTSIYERDRFYDAFPVSADKSLLGPDYITPHENPLQNPVPLSFMKVMPGVEFEFRFKLHDSKDISADLKLELFRQILLDLGIGAKTNVGYGQFEQDGVNSDSPNKENELEDLQRKKKEYQEKAAAHEANKTEAEKRIKLGESLECTVIRIEPGKKGEIFFEFEWDKGIEVKKKTSKIEPKDLKVGNKVRIHISENYHGGEVSFTNKVEKL